MRRRQPCQVLAQDLAQLIESFQGGVRGDREQGKGTGELPGDFFVW